MKMAEMELSKKEKKESMPTCASDEGPNYPYGLCLRLDNAVLEKLGIDSLPKVGARMKVMAEGIVTSVSSHESKNRDDRNVEIQIQQLAVENDDDSDELDDIVKRRKRGD